MSFFLENWMLMAVALGSAGMLMWPVLSKGAGVGDLSAQQAVQHMNRDKAVVVDVCEPTEFASGHIRQAKNIPLSRLEAELPTAVKNKTQPLIFVCASGLRSSRAALAARKLGYEKAQSLTGGMAAWREAGLPVQKNSAPASA